MPPGVMRGLAGLDLGALGVATADTSRATATCRHGRANTGRVEFLRGLQPVPRRHDFAGASRQLRANPQVAGHVATRYFGSEMRAVHLTQTPHANPVNSSGTFRGRAPLDQVLSRRRALGRRAAVDAGAAAARRRSEALARQPRHRVHGACHQLQRARCSREPRGQGPATNRCRSGRACGPVPAEHAALRDRVFRGAQGRRHGRELFAARCRTGARAQDRRQRDRPARHARPGGAVPADGAPARVVAAQEADRRQHGRLLGTARCRVRAFAGCGPAGASGCGRQTRGLRTTAEQRRRLRGACARGFDAGHRRIAIHRWHDRPAQRRDADARQPERSLCTVHGHGAGQTAGAGRGGRACTRRAAAVPHLRAHGEPAVRRAPRCPDGAAPALRSRRGDQRHRREEDQRVRRRADDVHRDGESPQGERGRVALVAVLRLGWRATAGRSGAAFFRANRLQAQRRLGHDRDFTDRYLHSCARLAQGRLVRHAAARHRAQIREPDRAR